MEIKSVGKNLIYQRKLKGFTQKKLSEKSEVTIRTIQRIEKGAVKPQLQTVKLLADALEIDLDDLIILENPKQESIQNKWLLFIHGSPLLGFVFPFSVLFSLFLWLHKREDHPVYNLHGIKVINFQLTITIIYILAFIALLTIEGWGFLFFILVVPINIMVIVYNVFRAVTVQKCYYPLSIPFLNGGSDKLKGTRISIFCLLGHFIVGCNIPPDKTQFEKLQEYDGLYEYTNNSEIELAASKMDTTLYAVLDMAKYPLKYITKDTFKNNQNKLVVFNRTANNEVAGYRVEGQDFKKLIRDYDPLEMIPRKEMFDNPDAYTYLKPTKENDGLATGNLSDEFKKPDLIIDMVKETIKGKFPDVHSILIFKNEKLVLEEYFYRYDKDTPHQLRSAIKPLIGVVVGIAVDNGFIESEKELLLPFFDGVYKTIDNMDNKKQQLTIEDFLQYRHGMDCENNNPESLGNEMTMRQSQDWVKHTLDLPMVAQPGAFSAYCTGCPLVLGSLVEIATNMQIEDFAKANFFDPMGITNYNWVFEPTEKNSGNFSETALTPRDLLKIAKMYKDGGRWNNKQILSEEWVDKTFDMKQGDYGYLWEHKYFVIDGKQYNSYMASGNGGQKINIWPELDMITVFTGGNYNSYQLYGKSTPPNEMIPKYILKAL